MLFTDIVGSTPHAASMGDERWTALIEEHNDCMRKQIAAHGGHEVKHTGDGFLIAFDDTDAAVRCALAAMSAVADLGLELRAGVHVGEVVHMGNNDLAGIAVHFAQRVCGRAEGGQLLASADVQASCEDPAIAFEERGLATLKGIPGKWEIFEAHR
jgi:class 3 adenylate cyclase